MSAGKINSKYEVKKSKWWHLLSIVSATAIVLAVLGLSAPAASADDDEPIVGLWEITVSYLRHHSRQRFTGWTGDGLEFDQDTSSPILSGYICYGHWIKLKGRNTYGLTHPYYDYDAKTGLWLGTSGYFNYAVTVSKDGKTFTGVENGKVGVSGANPYTGTGGDGVYWSRPVSNENRAR
jgi:hypothetical protein